MAHFKCINGHVMWDGDGKSRIRIFRPDFVNNFSKEDCMNGDDRGCIHFIDILEKDPLCKYEIWYCDACSSITVFDNDNEFKYEYVPMKESAYVFWKESNNWIEYYALRDYELKDFETHYSVLSNVLSNKEIIDSYGFSYSYKVSPDKKTILVNVLEKNQEYFFGYELARKTKIDCLSCDEGNELYYKILKYRVEEILIGYLNYWDHGAFTRKDVFLPVVFLSSDDKGIIVKYCGDLEGNEVITVEKFFNPNISAEEIASIIIRSFNSEKWIKKRFKISFFSIF